jgi:uncharacterized protein YicC (UPF0701 family)
MADVNAPTGGEASVNYSVKDLLALSELRASDRHSELLQSVNKTALDAASALATHQASDTAEYHRLTQAITDVSGKVDAARQERRDEAAKVEAALTTRIDTVDSRVAEYDKAKTAAETLIRAAKWIAGFVVVILTLVFAYMSTNGYGTG